MMAAPAEADGAEPCSLRRPCAGPEATIAVLRQARLDPNARLGATAATAAAAPAEGTAWRRDVLRSAFDDSLDLVHSWPAVAYAVWQLTALAGAGPGGSAGTPPPAPGLRVPLLACGVPCDIAPLVA